MAAIGMIAPMVESILCQALAALGKMYQEKKMNPPVHYRWTRADKAYCPWEPRWNCQFHFNNKNEAKNNIPLGIPQLAEACGLAQHLTSDFMTWFKAMFNYRDFMFHGGFEWSVGNRRKFTQLIEKEGWKQFFTCSTSRGEPWIYYLTNETIDILANLGERNGEFPLPYGRGDQVKNGGGPDSRDNLKPAVQTRDIYIPDLHIDTLKVKCSNFY
jgi:hypothetical protein